MCMLQWVKDMLISDIRPVLQKCHTNRLNPDGEYPRKCLKLLKTRNKARLWLGLDWLAMEQSMNESGLKAY
jgi:hypothetical protein